MSTGPWRKVKNARTFCSVFTCLQPHRDQLYRLKMAWQNQERVQEPLRENQRLDQYSSGKNEKNSN
jgi:hypothetical protein